MTEFSFYKRIIFKEFPSSISLLIFNELLGTGLLLIGVGTIIPLLSTVLGGQSNLTGPLGTFITELGILSWSIPYTLGFLAVLGVIRIFLDMIRMYLAGSIGVRLNRDLKLKMNQALIEADWQHFSKIDQGKYMQCLIVESSLARGAVNDMAGALAFALITSLLLCFLAIKSPITIIIFVIASSLFLFGNQSLMHKLRETSQQRIDKMAKMNTKVTDIKHSIKFLVAENLIPIVGQDVSILIQKIASVEKLQLFYSVIAKNFVSLLGLITILLVTLINIVVLENNGTNLLFDLIILQRVSSYFSNFQARREGMLQKIPSYDACMHMIKSAGETRHSHTSSKATIKFQDCLSVKNLSYSYDKSTEAISNINFSLPAKGMTLFYGPSGSGKTTTVDLLLGLLPIQGNGKIFYDNQSITSINPSSLSKIIAYVVQDSYILTGSLREFLTIGNNTINDKKIWHFLKLANVDYVVDSLPGKLDTIISSGGEIFSGGERQRLSIARALLREAKILILDEPSSSLDSASEKEIFKTLQNLSSIMLVIVITHSNEVIESMEHILLFENGKIVFEGNNSQLKMFRISNQPYQL